MIAKTDLKINRNKSEQLLETAAFCSGVSGTQAHSGGYEDKFIMIEDVVKNELRR